jgi:thiol-disulfide isomerase/thioredoxin
MSAPAVMTLTDPAQFDKLSQLIRQGPATLVLVFSPTCPHCHTYMPMWNQLKKTSNRQANMVTMEASVYDETPLSEQKTIESVPSVLYVNKSGGISEVSDIRNETNMKNILKTAEPEGTATVAASNNSGRALSNILESLPVASSSMPERPIEPVIPGQRSEPSPLAAIPAMPSSQKGAGRRHTRKGKHQQRQRLRLQRGGNPWAAFLASAGPAALLAGAYAALPARSSGLPAPRHSAKWRRIRARLTRRRRSNRR